MSNVKVSHIEDTTTNIAAAVRNKILAYDTTKGHLIYRKSDGTLKHVLTASSSNELVQTLTGLTVESGGYIGLGSAKGRFVFTDATEDDISIEDANFSILEGDLNLSGDTRGVQWTGQDGTAGMSFSEDVDSTTIAWDFGGTNAMELDSVDGLYAPIVKQFQVTKEPTGFENRTDSTLSFSAINRTVGLAGTYDIYIKGTKYTKTDDSIAFANTVGLWFIYYNNAGTLTASQTPWTIADTVQVATVYWDGAGGELGDERHGCTMDSATHDYLHFSVGARYRAGLALTVTTASNWSMSAGSYYDEDIQHDITTQTQAKVFYRNASGFTWTAASVNMFYQVASVLQYNNGTALADVSANQYMAMWCFATNNAAYPIAFIMGQRQDNTLANARANNTYESLVLGTLPYAEMKLLYRVIIQRNGAAVAYTETADYRFVSAVPSSYVATLHSALTGLSADDHTQYVLATGARVITGPQTIAQDGTTNLLILSGGITGTSQELLLGYDKANNYGIVQSVHQSVGYKPLALNSLGGNVFTNSASGFCFGNPDTDGTYKIVRSGTDLLFQRRESGSYVTKFTIGA